MLQNKDFALPTAPKSQVVNGKSRGINAISGYFLLTVDKLFKSLIYFPSYSLDVDGIYLISTGMPQEPKVC